MASMRPCPFQADSTENEIPTLAEAERRAIEAALKVCNGNIARAAALLDVAPSTLYRKRQGWILTD